MTAGNGFEEIYFSARDGLRLYARHFRPRRPVRRRPVLCLAGLSRNGRDFDAVANALANHAETPRDCFTLDIRGRGNSEYDINWKNYAIPVEMHDVIDFMTLAGLHSCGIIGTSRGGLITMLLAATQPGRIGAVVLNDIGPVIETDGLIRIAGYVGRYPVPKSWAEAARSVLDLNRRQFPGLDEAEAATFARQLWNEKNGRPAPGYDPKLAKCVSVLDGPVPPLWPQFEALKNVPVLTIRGANSDLLSAATVEEMQRRHANLSSITVPREGHAPLLRDASSIAAIAGFFARTD